MSVRLRLSAAICSLLFLSGCTNVVSGASKAPSGRCTIVGFEDLPAVSMDCGQTVPLQGLAIGYVARPTELDGHEIVYFISKDPLNDTVVMPPLNRDSAVVRQYAHSAVQGIERVPNADMIHIAVSDNCPVEVLYGHPQAVLNCHDAGPLLGWQITRAGAETVLPQGLVSQIEKTAERANGRTVYYLLSILQSG